MDLFRQMLSMDSTSGSERPMGEWLAANLEAPSVQTFEVGDGTLNVLLSWGTPRVVFCSHMDTVPPYIPPQFLSDRVTGRGSCDAKGQVWAMYQACRRLAAAGRSNFALLILSGEETGSWGAKAFARTDFRAPLLVVGEPTEGRMVSASKGTKSFGLNFIGEPFHSGYPQFGRSAVEDFIDFAGRLREAAFPEDPVHLLHIAPAVKRQHGAESQVRFRLRPVRVIASVFLPFAVIVIDEFLPGRAPGRFQEDFFICEDRAALRHRD